MNDQEYQHIVKKCEKLIVDNADDDANIGDFNDGVQCVLDLLKRHL